MTAALRAIQDKAESKLPALGYTVPYAVGNIVLTAWGPVIVAFPDCYSRLGCNQYINSAAIGRYEDYLIQEIVPHDIAARDSRLLRVRHKRR